MICLFEGLSVERVLAASGDPLSLFKIWMSSKAFNLLFSCLGERIKAVFALKSRHLTLLPLAEKSPLLSSPSPAEMSLLLRLPLRRLPIALALAGALPAAVSPPLPSVYSTSACSA